VNDHLKNLVRILLVAMDYERVKEYLIPILEKNLDKRLSYHGVHHTLEVIEAAERIGIQEGISGDDLILLKTAALLHDSGHLVKYKDHEDESIILASKILPQYGYSPEQIKEINKMIAATRVPQAPNDLLSKILCDADLDYLGTESFDSVGNTLLKELASLGFISGRESEWNQLQLNFLKKHHYFTRTAKQTRTKAKALHVKKIEKLVNSYSGLT
jgi:predicted metal-dependent HD superfamily phosphohydrolase